MKQEQGFKATKEQIGEWKKKHPNGVYEIEVEGFVAYVKAPDRNTLGYAATIGAKDPMKFNEAILNHCWLAGDDEIKTNDKLFMGVAAKLDQIIETAEASIKKL